MSEMTGKALKLFPSRVLTVVRSSLKTICKFKIASLVSPHTHWPVLYAGSVFQLDETAHLWIPFSSDPYLVLLMKFYCTYSLILFVLLALFVWNKIHILQNWSTTNFFCCLNKQFHNDFSVQCLMVSMSSVPCTLGLLYKEQSSLITRYARRVHLWCFTQLLHLMI